MSDLDSGNSVNGVLLDINLYETKRENNWSPIPSSWLSRSHLVYKRFAEWRNSLAIFQEF